MIAFVIHDACSSNDTVMFAESFDAWWAQYTNENKAVFELLGKVKDYGEDYEEDDAEDCEEFGRIHITEYIDEEFNNFQEFQNWCEKNKPDYEPLYVEAYNITDKLILTFGD